MSGLTETARRYRSARFPYQRFPLPTIVVSGVPFKLDMVVQTEMGYQFDVTGSMGVTLSATAEGSLSFGISYQKHRPPGQSQVQLASKADWSAFSSPPVLTGNSQVGLQVYLLPIVQLSVWQIGGPTLGLKAFVEVAAEAQAKTSIRGAEACAVAAASVGAQITIGGAVKIKTPLSLHPMLEKSFPSTAVYNVKWPLGQEDVCAVNQLPSASAGSTGRALKEDCYMQGYPDLNRYCQGPTSTRNGITVPRRSSDCLSGCGVARGGSLDCCSSACCATDRMSPPLPKPPPSPPARAEESRCWSIPSEGHSGAPNTCLGTSGCGWCVMRGSDVYSGGRNWHLGTAGACCGVDEYGEPELPCEFRNTGQPGHIDASHPFLVSRCDEWQRFQSASERAALLRGFKVGTTFAGTLRRNPGKDQQSCSVPNYVFLSMQVVEVIIVGGEPSMDWLVSISEAGTGHDGNTPAFAGTEQQLWKGELRNQGDDFYLIRNNDVRSYADFSASTPDASKWSIAVSRWSGPASLTHMTLYDSSLCTTVRLSSTSRRHPSPAPRLTGWPPQPPAPPWPDLRANVPARASPPAPSVSPLSLKTTAPLASPLSSTRPPSASPLSSTPAPSASGIQHPDMPPSLSPPHTPLRQSLQEEIFSAPPLPHTSLEARDAVGITVGMAEGRQKQWAQIIQITGPVILFVLVSVAFYKLCKDRCSKRRDHQVRQEYSRCLTVTPESSSPQELSPQLSPQEHGGGSYSTRA